MHVDHIVFASIDLTQGCDYIEEALGTRPVYGGVHEGRGTHNAVLGLGSRTYLEVIAPDPQQPGVPMWMGVFPSNNHRIIGWAVASDRLPEVEHLARQSDTIIGPVESGSRLKPDGSMLQWQLTLPQLQIGFCPIPFFVDWGTSVHPTEAIPYGGQFESLSIFHPVSQKVGKHLEALGLEIPCQAGSSQISVDIVSPDDRRVTLT